MKNCWQSLYPAKSRIAGIIATPQFYLFSQLVLFFTITVSINLDCEAIELALMPDRCHDVLIQEDDSTITCETKGSDPYLVWKLDSPISGESVLTFDYFCTTGIESFHGYYGPPIHAASRFDLPNVTISEGWSEFTYDLSLDENIRLTSSTRYLRLDPGIKPNTRFQIRNLRIRQPNQKELQNAKDHQNRIASKREHSRALKNYLTNAFSSEITSVKIFDTQIEIAISEFHVTDEPVFKLEEFPLWIDPVSEGLDTQYSFCNTTNTLCVPRYTNGRDRCLSGWRLRALGTDAKYVSSRRFADTEMEFPTAHRFSSPTLKSQKGLSGISIRGPLQDLIDLDVSAITVNFVLNQFIKPLPNPKMRPILGLDENLFFDPSPFTSYDRILKFANDNQITVSAIVLIPCGQSTRNRSPLIHPEADGGIYAMPNLTTQRGVLIYSHVLNEISKRYGNPDSGRGLITNWIAHNEIDFHHVWTNMGQQPSEIVMETYYRSMRLIHQISNANYQGSRVFASFTHHWNDLHRDDWKRMSPFKTIKDLHNLSLKEGDFDWGIAYHPYPEDLFSTTAWNDTNIQSNVQSPLITIQNIEVLGEFLRSESMRKHNRDTRPVILSEQGFHTPSYSEHHQNLQAASLLYAMDKIREQNWIESFHYHRWIDHPDEGGLKLGLRTLPTPENPFGEKKQTWYLYRVIGSSTENIARVNLQDIMNATDVDEAGTSTE